MKTSRLLAIPALIALGVTTLSACGATSLFEDTYDKQVVRTAKTGAEGKADELLASWVPDEATEIEVVQRTTGDERLLTARYDGDLPSTCIAIAEVGAPSEQELTESYATDPRMGDLEVDEVETAPLLDAEWWEVGLENNTTHLCGRWWVSQDEGTLYAFAPERTRTADEVRSEREAN